MPGLAENDPLKGSSPFMTPDPLFGTPEKNGHGGEMIVNAALSMVNFFFVVGSLKSGNPHLTYCQYSINVPDRETSLSFIT